MNLDQYPIFRVRYCRVLAGLGRHNKSLHRLFQESPLAIHLSVFAGGAGRFGPPIARKPTMFGGPIRPRPPGSSEYPAVESGVPVGGVHRFDLRVREIAAIATASVPAPRMPKPPRQRGESESAAVSFGEIERVASGRFRCGRDRQSHRNRLSRFRWAVSPDVDPAVGTDGEAVWPGAGSRAASEVPVSLFRSGPCRRID